MTLTYKAYAKCGEIDMKKDQSALGAEFYSAD